jgi:tetratricopeptide (TPR) repeat protein
LTQSPRQVRQIKVETARMVEEWWTVTNQHLQRGDWKTALVRLKKCDGMLASQLDYWKLLCCTYIQAGRWSDVSNVAASAAQRYSQESIFWECWSWAEHTQGESLTALRILESVSQKFENRESFVYTLACLYASLNRLDEAERCLDRAKELSSDSRSFSMKVAKQRELHVLLTADQLAFPA